MNVFEGGNSSHHNCDAELEMQKADDWWISLTRSSQNVKNLILLASMFVAERLPDRLRQNPFYDHALPHVSSTIHPPRLF